MTTTKIYLEGIDYERLHQGIEDRVRGEYAPLVEAAIAWHLPLPPDQRRAANRRLFLATVALEQDLAALRDARRHNGED